MKKFKISPALLFFVIITSFSFTFSDIDPGYISAFGYGSICVSHSGYPGADSYNASQFDFRDGKFYVKAGGTIDLRAILPQGKTYSDIMNEFKRENSGKYKDVVAELVYWKAYSSHGLGGNVLNASWPSDPSELLHSNNPLWFREFNTATGILDWKSSGVDFTDSDNDLKRDIGNWLSNAKPGWQIYIFHTVGWRRNCPEISYWDPVRMQTIVPISYEMAKPISYCIVEVK